MVLDRVHEVLVVSPVERWERRGREMNFTSGCMKEFLDLHDPAVLHVWKSLAGVDENCVGGACLQLYRAERDLCKLTEARGW